MSYANKEAIEKINTIKSVLDSYRPFSEHVVKQLRDYYRIGMTYASNAIERNIGRYKVEHVIAYIQN